MVSSTKNKLIVFLLIPLVIATYLIYGIVQKEGAKLIVQQKSNLLSLIVRNMSDSFDTLMNNRAKEIQTIASSFIVQNPKISLKQKKALFEKMKKSYPYYAWIGMTDTDGNIIAGTDNLLVGKNVKKRSWFIHGSQGLHMGDVHDAFLLAKIMPKPKWDDLPLRLVDISTPIYDLKGNFIGVLCGHLGWDWAFEIRNRVTEKLDNKNIDILVLKHDSSLLLGSSKLPSSSVDLKEQKSYLLSQKEPYGVLKEKWPDTKELYLTAFANNNPQKTDNIKWVVIARENMSYIQNEINSIKQKILIVFTILSLFLVFFVLYIVNRLIHPITTIANFAQKILYGEKDLKLPLFEHNKEANILSMTLNKLIQKLQEDLKKEKELVFQLEIFESIIENSPFGILITDKNNNIISINKAYEAITGYEKKEVIGKNPKILSSGLQNETFYTKMWKQLLSTGQWQGEIVNRKKDGETFSEFLTLGAIKDSEEIKNYIAIFSDITQMKQDKQQLEYLANYDALTKVYNRGKIKSRLKEYTQDPKTQRCSVIYVDLDYFKSINDTLGHTVGDNILQTLCQMLTQNFQEADLGRLGGDEFLLILNEELDRKTLLNYARGILKIIKKPIKVDNYTVNISASLGIASYPQDAQTCEQLIQAADIAMYSIKRKREYKNKIAFFTANLKQLNKKHNKLIKELQIATKNSDFHLVYQPQIDSKTNKLVGFETLIRWKHEEMGFVSPELFIGIAEEVGLIGDIDRWVFVSALEQWKKWQETYDMKGLILSINVSTIELKNTAYAAKIKNIIKKLDLNPETISIEITESAMFDNSLHVKENIEKIHAFGCKISVDDFGTGYSNLNELKSIKFDTLKIDKAFISSLFTDEVSKLIVKFAVDVSSTLGSKLIAEGAEKEEEVKELQKMGCSYIQGYFYSKPLNKDDVEKSFLKTS